MLLRWRNGTGDNKAFSLPFDLLGVEGCPQSDEERAAMEGIPYSRLW